MIATPATLPSDPASAPPRAHPDPLSTLLSSTLPLADLAASLNLSLPDFLNLCQSPDFQSQLAAVDLLTQTRLRIHSAQARLTAINALESLTKSTQDPVERRRAAASLMRATSAATQHARAGGGGVDDENDDPVERPRPRRLPSRRLHPEQVAALIARALADNDTPTPDSGLATLHAFLSTDTRAASPHLPDFITAARDQVDDQANDSPSAQSPMPSASLDDLPLPDLSALADLLDAREPPTCSTPVEHGRMAHVDLHPPPPIAHSPLPTAPSIRLYLTRPDTGPNRMCWLVDRITRAAPPTGPP